ncbi:MAG: oligosaccharide flippase family protein [Candidatus Sericytochromatia bacterium]|nr:oligosaccharide flippase family protein [Candidatus Sericytochromatia bacterium]
MSQANLAPARQLHVSVALRGVSWLALAQGLSYLVQWGVLVCVARQLGPEHYGSAALALFCLSGPLVLQELGLGQALMHRRAVESGHLAASLLGSLIVSLLLWLVLGMLAPLLAAVFATPLLAHLLPILAAALPLSALGTVPRAMLERASRFKAVAVLESLGAVLGGAASLATLMSGGGIWAALVGPMVSAAMVSLGAWGLQGRFSFQGLSRCHWQELWQFGGPVCASRCLGWLVVQLDTIVIGCCLGPAALGLYGMATKLVLLPTSRLAQVLLRVATPRFAAAREEQARLRQQYVRLIRGLAWITWPWQTSLLLLAPALLPALLGEAWREAVWLTQLLCVVGAFKGLVCSVGLVFQTVGAPQLELRLNILSAGLLLACLWIGQHWGWSGLAIGLLVSTLLGAPMQQLAANRALKLPFQSFSSALYAPLQVSAALAFLLTLGLFSMGAGEPSALATLGLFVLGGVGAHLCRLGVGSTFHRRHSRLEI